MIDTKGMGTRLRLARKDRGLTVDKASEQIGVNATYFRQIECGKSTPSLPVFVSICELLGVSSDYLLFGELSNNELGVCKELYALWKDAAPSHSKLIGSMLITALRELGIEANQTTEQE